MYARGSGGVPVAAHAADITDPKSRELIDDFNTLTGEDGIAFYPDWPTATFYDQLNAGLQELINGTRSSNQEVALLAAGLRREHLCPKVKVCEVSIHIGHFCLNTSWTVG